MQEILAVVAMGDVIMTEHHMGVVTSVERRQTGPLKLLLSLIGFHNRVMRSQLHWSDVNGVTDVHVYRWVGPAVRD